VVVQKQTKKMGAFESRAMGQSVDGVPIWILPSSNIRKNWNSFLDQILLSVGIMNSQGKNVTVELDNLHTGHMRMYMNKKLFLELSFADNTRHLPKVLPKGFQPFTPCMIKRVQPPALTNSTGAQCFLNSLSQCMWNNPLLLADMYILKQKLIAFNPPDPVHRDPELHSFFDKTIRFKKWLLAHFDEFLLAGTTDKFDRKKTDAILLEFLAGLSLSGGQEDGAEIYSYIINDMEYLDDTLPPNHKMIWNFKIHFSKLDSGSSPLLVYGTRGLIDFNLLYPRRLDFLDKPKTEDFLIYHIKRDPELLPRVLVAQFQFNIETLEHLEAGKITIQPTYDFSFPNRKPITFSLTAILCRVGNHFWSYMFDYHQTNKIWKSDGPSVREHTLFGTKMPLQIIRWLEYYSTREQIMIMFFTRLN